MIASAPKPVHAAARQQIPCAVDGCGEAYVVPVGTVVSKDFKFVCKGHTPQTKRAGAKGVRPSAISPEVRKQIKQQLAAPPAIREPQNSVEMVETSQGTKTVTAGPDGSVDVDDAADSTDKNIRKNTRAIPGPPRRQPSKQPAYLKSVAQSVVKSWDPEAPYGRDEENRPIKAMRTDQELAVQLLAKDWDAPGSADPCNCNQPLCKHCHPENIVQTDVLRVAPVQMDIEEDLRNQFGLSKRLPVRVAPKKFDYFPEILGISRGALFYLLLDGIVGTEVVRIGPGTKTKVKKTTRLVEQQIAKLTAELEAARKRISELKRLIAESEDIVHGLGKKVMDSRRAENPDDILDKSTREKFKREEKKKIVACEQEKRELETRLRESNLEDLQQRLANWGSSPDDYDHVETAETREVPVIFKEKFKEPEDEIKDTSEEYNQLRLLRVSKTDAYISLLSSVKYEGLKSLCRRHPLLSAWRYFENEIVLQAIGWKLIHPTKHAFLKYPELNKCLSPSDEEDEYVPDDTENALIIKTGGAQIGASIYGGGTTWGGKQRSVTSFDKTVAYGNKDAGEAAGQFAPPGEFFGDVDSGDFAERYEE